MLSNIKIGEECLGCSILHKFSDGNFYCRATMNGVEFFSNCPCRECLLKMMCNEVCIEFKNSVRKKEIYKI